MITKFITKGETLGHVAILPDDYNSKESFPCIIFLHGSGERSDGLSELALKKTIVNGPAKYLKDNRFIILCPQTDGWSWRSTKTVNGVKVVTNDAVEFTKWALENYKIDPKQLHGTGLSMGSEGIWFAASDAPELWTTIAPVCGRAARSDGEKIAKAGIRVWGFHGSADTSIPFESHWNAIAGHRAVNKSLSQFTVYEGVGHNCWDRAYSNMGLYTWFLKYSK